MDPASIAFAALAEEYRRAGLLEEAIATCAGGLKRHPSYLSAHVTLGRALLQSGRIDDAREALEFVLRASPENLSAIQALAEIERRGAGTQGEIGPPPSTTHPQVDALESFLDAVRKAR